MKIHGFYKRCINFAKKLYKMVIKSEGRQSRPYHPEYVKYMKEIITHPNYSGLPIKNELSEFPSLDELKSVWVAFKKSPIGQNRIEWWDVKREEFNILKETGWLTETAKRNFPFKKRPCQICGKFLSIHYVYPNKNLLVKLNEIKAIDEEFSSYDLPITEIIEIISKIPDGLKILKEIFKIPDNIKANVKEYSEFVLINKISHLSPGVMGNPPDRLDGFHSYNNCCRGKEDTGRSKENLSKYGDDRRAYENWSDGDYKTASWLMKELTKRGLSADHIGPISQGFTHRPNFAAMSLKENITKRDRLGLDDLKMLLDDEKKEQVMSWHTIHVWDLLKLQPTTEQEANALGEILRKNVHNVLNTLSIFKNEGYEDFLASFLHPEFAFYEPKFTKIDTKTRTYEFVRIKGDIQQYENHAKRIVRISLDSLDAYDNKDNRNVKLWKGDEIDKKIKLIITHLKKDDIKSAKKELDNLLQIFAQHGKQEYLLKIRK